jgi:uncharacterized membrane protein YvlD (DUF360 family)
MLWLTDLIVGDFNISGFWNYVWATILVWLVNMVLDVVIFRDRGPAVSYSYSRRQPLI